MLGLPAALQVGTGLLDGYGGRTKTLISAAHGSAAQLVQLVTAAFPGFRDHAIYRCNLASAFLTMLSHISMSAQVAGSH